MDSLMSFLTDGFVVVALIIGILVQAIKHKTGASHGWMPLIALGIGLIIGILHNCILLGEGFNQASILFGVQQGIISGAVAIVGYDLIKGVTDLARQD